MRHFSVLGAGASKPKFQGRLAGILIAINSYVNLDFLFLATF